MAMFRLNRKAQVALASAIAALIVVGAISYRGMVISRQSDHWVRHTYEVLDSIKDLHLALEHVESTSRAFVLTGSDADLAAYRASKPLVARAETAVRRLTLDNDAQQRRLPAVESLVAQKFDAVETAIALRTSRGAEAALDSFRSGPERRLTEALQERLGGLRGEELRLLASRDADATRDLFQAEVVLIIAIVVSLSMSGAAGWGFQRDTFAGVEALRRSEERYRMLLGGVQDYAIFMLDPAGMVVSWNAGAQRIKGYTAEEILGRNFSCFFLPDPEEQRRSAEILRTTAEIGRHEEQCVRVRKDGSRFVGHWSLTALRDSYGHLRGFSEVCRDLSERKESEAKYRGLLEAAPDAMVVVDAGGKIVLLNVQAERRFGYQRHELVGQQMTTLIPDGFAARLIADALRSTQDALEQQIGAGIELAGRRKDGTTFPIEIMLSPLESADGVLVTAAIRDITARKNAEAFLLQKVAELDRSNEELGQFASIASHDLQEPLRMVASYTQLLSRRYTGRLDAEADEFIAFAVDGAARMQTLIQDLLAYSRVGSKGKTLVGTSSEHAFELAMGNLRGAIADSGADVTHDPLPMVLADATQLVQLFQNLVGNGIKYQRPGVPRVHVSVGRERGEKWLFAVKDNGLGIEPQYFERIFGMFQRLHKRDEFAGTGIGLAISRKIMERHGGTISVESQPGEGSTFRFALVAIEATT
jgi:PAS domain S-box-containing protein